MVSNAKKIRELERRKVILQKEVDAFFRKHKNPVKASIIGLATGMSDKAEELWDIKATIKQLKKVV